MTRAERRIRILEAMLSQIPWQTLEAIHGPDGARRFVQARRAELARLRAIVQAQGSRPAA